jgi:dihydrofolate reductase
VIISLVAAVAENGINGRDGGLPWRLPADLRFFKLLTLGHTVIMGRRTWDEIGKPLPNRRNIVVTRNKALEFPGAERAPYLGSALALTVAEDEVFVIGGGKIYTEALPMAHRMYLTHVHAEVEGDTRFPEWDPAEWEMVSEERHEADDRHAHAFTIRRYDRRSA